MATQTTYTFSISTNFPNAMVDSGSLTISINNSTISSAALSSIDTSGDICHINFIDVLSGVDQTILNNIVSSHTGLPLPSGITYIVNTISSPSSIGIIPNLSFLTTPQISSSNVVFIFNLTKVLNIKINGSFSGVLAFDSTIDGYSWTTVNVIQTSNSSSVNSTASPGIFSFINNNLYAIRVRATTGIIINSPIYINYYVASAYLLPPTTITSINSSLSGTFGGYNTLGDISSQATVPSGSNIYFNQRLTIQSNFQLLLNGRLIGIN